VAPRRSPLALVGVLVPIFLLAGCGGDEPTRSTRYSLPTSVKSLKVTGEVGEVTVTAKRGASKIAVKESRTEKAKPSHVSSGSTASLKYDCPGGFSFDTCRVDHDITVPTAVAVNVDNSSGKITLTGSLNDTVARADAGQIKGTSLGSSPVSASTSGGEVDLTFASPPRNVKASTKAGDTTITVPGNASYQVKADTSVGDTNVDVPNDPSAPNRIEATTDVGTVSIKKG
jgi:hypothetical protein